MSDAVTFRLERKESLFAKLRQLTPALDKTLAEATLAAAEEAAGLARRFVRSGRVRATIKAEKIPEKTAPSARVVAGDRSTAVELRKGSGKKGNLALFEEFGTKPHRLGGIFAGAWHPGTAARPYFWPAITLTKKRARGKMSRAFTKAARSVAK